MDALECIKTRRSVHSFLDKPVEFEKITQVLEAGNMAPSAGNLQDWKFLLVTDKALIRLISEHCAGQYWIAEAPVLVIICALPDKQESYYGLRGKRLYTIQDTAAAAMNMLIAANSLEVGGCWVGAFDEAKVAELLAIPRDARPQVLLAFGYTASLDPLKTKIELKNIVYFNRYGNKIEHVHRVLKDWSVEWDRALNEQAAPFLERSMRRIAQRMKDLKENLADEYKKRREYAQQKKKDKEKRHKQAPLR